MSFRKAVEDAPPPVNGAYRNGIQVLEGRHRPHVRCGDARRLKGSIDLDRALAQEPGYANAPRWDYGIGYSPRQGPEQAVWIEVHSATTSEVSAVLRKLQWLRDWLNGNAEQLLQVTNAADRNLRFVWIASDKVHVLKNSPQARRLAASGIGKARRHLSLP